MPYKSRWSIDIPILSLTSYVFKTPNAHLEDKPLLIDAEKPEYYLSHHSYREWSKRLAAGLRKAGFQTGDRLLLYSGNNVFFPVILQGAVMAGGIFTGANPSYVARELAYQLLDSGASFLITSEGSLDTALEAASSIKFPRDRMFVMGDGYEVFENRAQAIRGIQHWTSFLASPAESSKFEWEEFSTDEQMNRTAVLNYSSGTTGVPKGVEISHLNYVSNCMQTDFMQHLSPTYHEWLQRARSLSFLPMYHAYGQTHHGVSMILKGIPVYMMRKFDFMKMLEYVQKYRITNLALVPPIAVAMTKRPEVKNFDLSSIESAGCGAAPLSAETIVDFEKMFDHRFQLKQGWGMTEITCSACGWDPNLQAEPSKVGELNPNIEAMIVDDKGRELGDEVRGEFWVRGPNVMKGYWGKLEATAETKTEEGWLKTGDIAVRHADGYWSIVDRKKVGCSEIRRALAWMPTDDFVLQELIKVKGNQVAPAELEGVLLDHPAVSDAAVVGGNNVSHTMHPPTPKFFGLMFQLTLILTRSGEELPRGYVVLRSGQSASPQEIASWLADRVARHKRLVGGVVCVDEIPKNPSGKILRKIMRERAKSEVGDRGEGKRESRL